MQKQTGKGAKVNSHSDWIISLGLHEPLIDAQDWLAVQRTMEANEFCKDGKNPPTLLKGVVRCARCGCLLAVRRNGKRYGNYAYYGCEKRVYMGAGACGLPYVPASDLDDAMMDMLRKAVLDESVLEGFYADRGKAASKEEAEEISKAIRAAERKLENLTKALTEAGESNIRKYILQEMGAADSELCRLREREEQIKSEKEAEARREEGRERNRLTLENFMENFETLTAEEKNSVMKMLFKKCEWDGETLTAYMSD